MELHTADKAAVCRRHTRPLVHAHCHQPNADTANRLWFGVQHSLSSQHRIACAHSRHSSSLNQLGAAAVSQFRRRRATCLDALAPSSPQSSPSAAEDNSSPSFLQQLQPGTLLQSQVEVLAASATSNSSTQARTDIYLEVLTGWDVATQSFTAASEGRRLRLSLQDVDGSQVLKVIHLGPHLPPTAALVSSFPGWSAGLAKLQSQLGQPPAYSQVSVLSCRPVLSLQQLEQQVQQDPSPWCTGTAPGQAPPSGVDYQVQSAGELLCLLSGSRGLVMVQLYVGWDAGLAQPVFNPYVLTLLQRVVANKDLTITMSSIQNGLGVTALISPKKDPWKSWAKHMASFGAQAALVAGSPFYQLLIGRMLGYKEEYIQHHIMANSSPGSGRLTPQVVAAVDAEMARLSAKKPTLPWNQGGSRGKKKTSK